MNRLLSAAAAIILLIVGCGPSQSSATIDVDSLNTTLYDSAAKKAHPDQNKAIGEITFGISEKEFIKKRDLFLKKSNPNEFGTQHSFGGYYFINIHGNFDDDKLYGIEVKGKFIHYDEYKSRLVDQVEILRLMMVNKYGEPNSGSGAPEWHKTEKDYTYLAYEWNIGTKDVVIRVANHGVYYSADLNVYKPDIVQIIEDKRIEAKSNKAKNAADVL